MWQRHGKRRTADYEVTMPGLKYTMSDITAAVGLQQFQKLTEFTARRTRIAASYDRSLAGLPGLRLPTVLDGVRHGWFLYPVLIDPVGGRTRGTVADELRDAYGIGTSVHFKPVHRLAAYRYLDCHLPITEQIAAQQLSLPCYPTMTGTDVQRVIDALHAIWT
ncbi:DegT/DnrJ/EryC1/StrS family aminotransferase [Kitasatospora sp. NPDC094016]|uniref:DegT/DnrJ/EryC1/StrS family aminotransferase n=1 Tax=Kitasatospora sp. NPDC094016 TaxID=3154986 RepID=UPI00331CEE52